MTGDGGRTDRVSAGSAVAGDGGRTDRVSTGSAVTGDGEGLTGSPQGQLWPMTGKD